jgi:hypothetical protein
LPCVSKESGLYQIHGYHTSTLAWGRRNTHHCKRTEAAAGQQQLLGMSVTNVSRLSNGVQTGWITFVTIGISYRQYQLAKAWRAPQNVCLIISSGDIQCRLQHSGTSSMGWF